MFTIRSELKGYFDYDGLGLYLRAHETAEIDGVIVDDTPLHGTRGTGFRRSPAREEEGKQGGFLPASAGPGG